MQNDTDEDNMILEQILEDIDKAYDNLAKRRQEIGALKVNLYDDLADYKKVGSNPDLIIASQNEMIAIDETSRIKDKLTAMDVYAKMKWGEMCDQYRHSNELYAEMSNKGLAEMGEALKEISMKP